MKKYRYFLYMLLVALTGMFSACSDDDDIAAVAPEVKFTVPENGYSVEIGDRLVPEVSVTGTDPMTFNWTVDGTEVTTDRDYVFKSTQEGVYRIALTAKNSAGVSTADAQVLVVKPGTDIATAIDIDRADPNFGRNAVYEIGATVHSLHNVDYIWTVTTPSGEQLTSSDRKLRFNPTEIGEYTLSLKVRNILAEATDEVKVNICHGDLAVEIEGQPEVECGQILPLHAKVTGDAVTSYEWSVNGEKIAEGETFEFMQLNQGDYNVTLKVTNEDGKSFETTRTIKVYSNGLNFGLRLGGIDTELGQGEEMKLEAVCTAEGATYQWNIDGKNVAVTKEYIFKDSGTLGSVHNVKLTITLNGKPFEFTKTITIGEKYHQGAFMLFEGNMGSENGAISFLSDGGTVYNNLFRTNNPGLQLGNVCQGMFLFNRKVYIVSQNGSTRGGGGIVTVMDGRTMKLIKAYPNDILYDDSGKQILRWPREIGVVSDRYAILSGGTPTSNASPAIFDMDTEKITVLPNDANGEYFSTFACVSGKAYAAYGKSVYRIDVENKKIGELVHTFDFDISSIRPVRKGVVWVISSLSQAVKHVAKCDANFNVIKQQTTPKMPQTDGASMQFPRVSCGTEYIFFSTSSTGVIEPVWKYHFESNTAVALDKIGFYNAQGFNEAKGSFYVGTLEEYDVSGSRLNFIRKYGIGGASFPAGIWFTHDFDRW